MTRLSHTEPGGTIHRLDRALNPEHYAWLEGEGQQQQQADEEKRAEEEEEDLRLPFGPFKSKAASASLRSSKKAKRLAALSEEGEEGPKYPLAVEKYRSASHHHHQTVTA